jgi:hypothetical protein
MAALFSSLADSTPAPNPDDRETLPQRDEYHKTLHFENMEQRAQILHKPESSGYSLDAFSTDLEIKEEKSGRVCVAIEMNSRAARNTPWIYFTLRDRKMLCAFQVVALGVAGMSNLVIYAYHNASIARQPNVEGYSSRTAPSLMIRLLANLLARARSSQQSVSIPHKRYQSKTNILKAVAGPLGIPPQSEPDPSHSCLLNL